MKKIIMNNLWWVTFLLAVALLVVHSLKLVEVSVDSTSIFLLLIILISPFISTLKKIKYGDFEAEIDPKEIQSLKENVENTLESNDVEEELRNEAFEEGIAIRDLAKSDPVIALAKVRIELEKLLNSLATRTIDNTKKLPLGRLVRKLTDNEVISKQLGNSLNEVISICNRAIHGEYITDESANTVVELGIELLEELNWNIVESSSIATIIKEKIISPQEVDDYTNKKYKLTTVIPLVENPKMIVRELTHAQFEDVLEGYETYAEFIVELIEIRK